MIDIHELEFEPPGPGSWQINSTHVPRPWPRFQAAIYSEQLSRGFQDMSRRYGFLFDFEMPFVNGFAYFRLAPVADAKVPERITTAERVFECRLWRDDLQRWEHEAKPAAVRAHLALQAVDPVDLDEDTLAEHLDRCRMHLKRMIYQHHWFNGAWTVPMGDFLTQGVEMTGLAIPDLLPLLRGSTPVSAGRSDELAELVAAVRSDVVARAAFGSDGDEPGRVLERVRSLPGPAGRAAVIYLEMVGYRLIDGHNVGENYSLEQPAKLLEAIRRRIEIAAEEDANVPSAEAMAYIRDRVPDCDRAGFDALLAEARLTCALRDERGVFCDVWAAGITRRVILEAGRRLASRDRIERAEHLVEAEYDEMRALMSNGGGPAAEELAARAEFRIAYDAADAPHVLGTAPEPPPPLDGLPPGAARVARAVDIALGLIFQPSEAQSDANLVRGLGASPGVYEGTARLIRGPAEFGQIEAGDVLVTHCTSEAFNLLLPLVSAIVTDAGGYLSHPAIVAREYGIPAVVGSLDATRLIPDGARVRVDGDAGEVTVMG